MGRDNNAGTYLLTDSRTYRGLVDRERVHVQARRILRWLASSRESTGVCGVAARRSEGYLTQNRDQNAHDRRALFLLQRHMHELFPHQFGGLLCRAPAAVMHPPFCRSVPTIETRCQSQGDVGKSICTAVYTCEIVISAEQTSTFLLTHLLQNATSTQGTLLLRRSVTALPTTPTRFVIPKQLPCLSHDRQQGYELLHLLKLTPTSPSEGGPKPQEGLKTHRSGGQKRFSHGNSQSADGSPTTNDHLPPQQNFRCLSAAVSVGNRASSAVIGNLGCSG